MTELDRDTIVIESLDPTINENFLARFNNMTVQLICKIAFLDTVKKMARSVPWTFDITGSPRPVTVMTNELGNSILSSSAANTTGTSLFALIPRPETSCLNLNWSKGRRSENSGTRIGPSQANFPIKTTQTEAAFTTAAASSSLAATLNFPGSPCRISGGHPPMASTLNFSGEMLKTLEQQNPPPSLQRSIQSANLSRNPKIVSSPLFGSAAVGGSPSNPWVQRSPLNSNGMSPNLEMQKKRKLDDVGDVRNGQLTPGETNKQGTYSSICIFLDWLMSQYSKISQ